MIILWYKFLLSDWDINLNLLFAEDKVDIHGYTKALIWLTTIYIFTFYEKHSLYFSYKADGRGRIYQEAWPANLIPKSLDLCFILKKLLVKLNTIGPSIHIFEK